MDSSHPALKKCTFLKGIPETEYDNVLHCLKAKSGKFFKDDIIMNIGDKKLLAGVVLEGIAETSFLDETGNQVNIHHISNGEIFGAILVCAAKSFSPVRLKAITNCYILFLDFTVLLNPPIFHCNNSQQSGICCPYWPQVAANMLKDFSRQALFMNQRLRILSQRKLRDKLKVFFQTLPQQENNTIILPFNRNELAEYLYADRSALSRELSRMSDESLIKFQGKIIHILDKNFLKK